MDTKTSLISSAASPDLFSRRAKAWGPSAAPSVTAGFFVRRCCSCSLKIPLRPGRSQSTMALLPRSLASSWSTTLLKSADTLCGPQYLLLIFNSSARYFIRSALLCQTARSPYAPPPDVPPRQACPIWAMVLPPRLMAYLRNSDTCLRKFSWLPAPAPCRSVPTTMISNLPNLFICCMVRGPSRPVHNVHAWAYWSLVPGIIGTPNPRPCASTIHVRVFWI